MTITIQNTNRLYPRLAMCQQLAALGGVVSIGADNAVVIGIGRRSLGLWSVRRGEFVFRDCANYEPLLVTSDIDEAHRMTLALLADHRDTK